MGAHRRLRITLDIYNVAPDADPNHVAQALGFPMGEPMGFDDIDLEDPEVEAMFDATGAEWIDGQ